MVEGSLDAHISYLEEEVRRIGERADKLEAMIPNPENAHKKHALRELVSRLRAEVSEYRKYLAVMKPK